MEDHIEDGTLNLYLNAQIMRISMAKSDKSELYKALKKAGQDVNYWKRYFNEFSDSNSKSKTRRSRRRRRRSRRRRKF